SAGAPAPAIAGLPLRPASRVVPCRMRWRCSPAAGWSGSFVSTRLQCRSFSSRVLGVHRAAPVSERSAVAAPSIRSLATTTGFPVFPSRNRPASNGHALRNSGEQVFDLDFHLPGIVAGVAINFPGFAGKTLLVCGSPFVNRLVSVAHAFVRTNVESARDPARGSFGETDLT